MDAIRRFYFRGAGHGAAGKNAIYLAQELQFKAPVKIGDTVTATVEVLRKLKEKIGLFCGLR